jgi:hypothetical protein
MSGHLWCEIKNMWCSDTDEEDYAENGCDGDCKGCVFSEVYEDEGNR